MSDNKQLNNETELLLLMNELDIEQCCVTYTMCTNGPAGPKVLDREIMIGVGNEDGAAKFLAIQEFSWKDKTKQVNRLQELLWSDD